jgi:hypothetical protein
MGFLVTERYRHGDRLVIEGASVRLRVDARARRVSLRIDQQKREVICTAPTERRLAEAVAFAHDRAVWIAGQMVRLPKAAALAPGRTIQVMGAPCRLEAGTGRARLMPAEGAEPMRIVARDDERFTASVVRLLKAEARRVLAERTRVHAEALGQPLPTVAVMDAKGRWGSCTPAPRGLFVRGPRIGRIRYSWRLILAPYEVMDYVAAHEAAHLIEANHSDRFWALVEQLVGPAKPHRAWLRTHGPALHAFGGEGR